MGAAVFHAEPWFAFYGTGTKYRYHGIHVHPHPAITDDEDGPRGGVRGTVTSVGVPCGRGPSPVFMSKSENKCVIIIKYSHHLVTVKTLAEIP